MTTRIDINEVFDQDGNLISSETVEVELPGSPDFSAFVNTLTDEQRAALVATLRGF